MRGCKNGTVRFFKDGYTDLRGRFDYASLNSPANPPPPVPMRGADSARERPRLPDAQAGRTRQRGEARDPAC